MLDRQFHGFESHLPSKTENQGIAQASKESWSWSRTGQSNHNNLPERNGLGQQSQQHNQGCIEFTNPYPQEALRGHNPRGNFHSYTNGMSDGHQPRQQFQPNQQFHQFVEQQRPLVQEQDHQQVQHRPHTGAFGSYNGGMAAPKVENITIQRGVHNVLHNDWSFHSHIRPDGK